MRKIVCAVVVAAAALAGAGQAAAVGGFAFTERPLVVAPGTQALPSISGERVAYVDSVGGLLGVLLYDGGTGSSRVLAIEPWYTMWAPKIAGPYVVYVALPIMQSWGAKLRVLDLRDGSSREIPGDGLFDWWPKISDRYVAYAEYGGPNDQDSDVCTYELATGATRCLRIPGPQTAPDVNGSTVVYVDSSAPDVPQVWAWNLDDGSTRRLSTGGSLEPAIDGGHVVYQRLFNDPVTLTGSSHLVVYDLVRGRETAMLAGVDPQFQVAPHISGDWVSFDDYSEPGRTRVAAWNFATGDFQELGLATTQQSDQDIDGTRIVYDSLRDGGWHIYETDISVADVTPPVVTVPSTITADATSPAGAVVTYSATATDDQDPAPAIVCLPASGSTFAMGATSVTCTARDASGNVATAWFQVIVKGAADQIGDLEGGVKGLSLPKGTQTSLLAKLDAAKAALAAGDTVTACADLASFVSEVSAQSGKKITAAVAAALIAEAQRIQAVIPC